MIKIPNHVSRGFVQAHREWIFVYGLDHQHKGFFGQAYSLHLEPNAFPVPTCRKMCKSSRYWSDGDFDEVKGYIDEAVARIPRDGRPIIVLEKLGTGGSCMDQYAPKLFTYLKMKLDEIKCKEVEVDYGT